MAAITPLIWDFAVMKRIALIAASVLTSVALFTPWLFGEARGTQTASRLEAPYPLTFPDDFA